MNRSETAVKLTLIFLFSIQLIACGKAQLNQESDSISALALSSEELLDLSEACPQWVNNIANAALTSPVDHQCFSLYVDFVKGSDLESGNSKKTATKSIERAFELSREIVPTSTRLIQKIMVIVHVSNGSGAIVLPLQAGDQNIVVDIDYTDSLIE